MKVDIGLKIINMTADRTTEKTVSAFSYVPAASK